MKPFRLGVLEAGQPNADLASTAGSYLDMIRAALGAQFTYEVLDLQRGELPAPDAGSDGYIITGSTFSAYDPIPWIAHLHQWLKELSVDTPVVGICFGHQVMARAYGGTVERARQGLAVGLHSYEVRLRQSWMDDVGRFVIPVSHYDQVVERPPAGGVFASNDFCAQAGLVYQDRRAMSVQGHPEAPLELVARAIDRWERRGLIGPSEAKRARASMNQPDDRARVMSWIGRFLRGAD